MPLEQRIHIHTNNINNVVQSRAWPKAYKQNVNAITCSIMTDAAKDAGLPAE